MDANVLLSVHPFKLENCILEEHFEYKYTSHGEYAIYDDINADDIVYADDGADDDIDSSRLYTYSLLNDSKKANDGATIFTT